MNKSLKILLAAIMIVAFMVAAVGCKAEEAPKEEGELDSEALEQLEKTLDDKKEEIIEQAKQQEKNKKDIKKEYKADTDEPAAEMTFDDIVEVYKAEGVEVDLEDKPLFNTYGSINAVIFYVDREPTYFYEYICEEMVNDCTEEMEFCRTFGRFAIKTYGDRAKEIFDNLGDTNNTEPPEIFLDADEEAANVAVEHILKAFEDAGVELEAKETSAWRMVGAKRSTRFYNTRVPVTIYEFGNKELLEESSKEFASTYGRFGLNTECEESIKIFDHFMAGK